jgi:hypothetical protein
MDELDLAYARSSSPRGLLRMECAYCGGSLPGQSKAAAAREWFRAHSCRAVWGPRVTPCQWRRLLARVEQMRAVRLAARAASVEASWSWFTFLGSSDLAQVTNARTIKGMTKMRCEFHLLPESELPSDRAARDRILYRRALRTQRMSPPPADRAIAFPPLRLITSDPRCRVPHVLEEAA